MVMVAAPSSRCCQKTAQNFSRVRIWVLPPAPGSREIVIARTVMKTLLVPVDLSDASTPVVDKAAELAQQLAARVILLHIVEPVATYVPVGATMDVIAAAPPILETAESLSTPDNRLKASAERFVAVGVQSEIVTLVGLAVDDIVEQAMKHHADYIILGSHGHGALYHLFSGSVITGILKRTPCPVIIVPSSSGGAR
jgi:nucleotide-binding universal stress UspA family protein